MRKPTNQPMGYSLIAVTVSALIWAMEQGMPNWFGPSWSDIPWGSITALLGAFFLGQVVTDYKNSRSWLRYKINTIGKLYVADSLQSVHVNDYIVATQATFHFLRPIRNAVIVARVVTFDGAGKIHANRQIEIPCSTTVIGDKQIEIAAVRNTEHIEGSWFSRDDFSVEQGTKNLVSIRVSANGVQQTTNYFIEFLTRKTEQRGLYYSLMEYDQLFDVFDEVKNVAWKAH